MMICPVPNPKPQKTDYWCGNTAIQYVLAEHFINMSQEDLANRLETSEDMGTDGGDMVEILESLGMEVKVFEGGDGLETLELAQKLRYDGYSIIFNYLVGDNLEEDGHYIVFQHLNRYTIDILDPSDGLYKKIDTNNFISRWVDLTKYGKIVKSWMLAVRRKNDQKEKDKGGVHRGIHPGLEKTLRQFSTLPIDEILVLD